LGGGGLPLLIPPLSAIGTRVTVHFVLHTFYYLPAPMCITAFITRLPVTWRTTAFQSPMWPVDGIFVLPGIITWSKQNFRHNFEGAPVTPKYGPAYTILVIAYGNQIMKLLTCTMLCFIYYTQYVLLVLNTHRTCRNSPKQQSVSCVWTLQRKKTLYF